MDQLLADEHVDDLQTEGDVVWPLVDHLNTVRDLATYDSNTDTTTIANHRVYDAYGNLTSETNAAVDCLFGYTGRQFDESTGLQNNLNRWYDAKVGRWMSKDPIGFDAGDANVYRYVGNNSTTTTDPNGLCRQFFSDYFHYLFNPSKMDMDLRVAQAVSLATAALAGTAAASCAVAGISPWLGTIAIHGPHHTFLFIGRSSHLQIMIRTGVTVHTPGAFCGVN